MRARTRMVVAAGCWLAAFGCKQDDTYPIDPTPPVDYVNPFIGSGGLYWEAGSVYPGAGMPFGMVKAGPDTTKENGAEEWHHFSGYHYEDDYINGFSQVHISGTGAADYGALLLMPTVGFGADKTTEGMYRSRFSKENESASPGAYDVLLDDHGIQVELTATTRCAFHRYTWPAGSSDGFVLVDLSHAIVGCRVDHARLGIDAAAGELSGQLLYQGSLTGRSGGFTLYFVVRFDSGLSGWQVWRDGELLPEAEAAEGEDVGVAVPVDTAVPVEVRVGVSYVDVAGARGNLEAELAGRAFDTVRQEARRAWAAELGRVTVQGGTEDERVMFYSALYRAMFHPTTFTDSDGRYTGFDKQAHQTDGFVYYTDFSMWDTYRTVHSLFNLIHPARQRDMVVSLLTMYEQGGYLPKWPAATGYTGCMIGTPADIVISESYLKGIRDFDAGTAFDAIRANATTAQPRGGRAGVEHYMQLGYVPADLQGGATSRTLEFANADAAIARFARALGRDDDAEDFESRAQNYRNVWDPVTQFMRGKNADGTWAEPDEAFDPLDWNAPYYTEGDAWQTTWLVPHDPRGLIELFGGPDPMADKLEAFFATPEPEDDGIPSYLLPRRYYWHGNEPDIHAAYFFCEAGRPDRTQHWVRHVLATRYGTGADGLAGNDDLGTLSAWYVFSASGFYPIAGQDLYYVTSPLFERVTFRLGDGKVFEVHAEGASAENKYIQSARLDGEPLDVPWFTHADIQDGAVLELEMGAQPSGWGT